MLYVILRSKGGGSKKACFFQQVLQGLLVYHTQTNQKIKGGKMRVQEIREIAKDIGIRPYRMKKTDIIQAIQREEKNIECFGTKRVDICQEEACSWRSDCLTLNKK
jgi:cystathionine beta-lyase family protein involved in aluminum resistance